MPLPILTTDYFSKPEPVGSINGSVARLMATAGAALAERVEKQTALAEARLKAPAITKAFAMGYDKIARGEFSGFADLSAAQGMGIGNPLLMGMAKEGADLGVSLANNYTQSAILKDRLKTQEEMTKLRIDAQTGSQYERERFATAQQEDRQAHTQSMLAERDYLAEVDAVEKENEKRTKANEVAKATAAEESKLTGKQIQPTLVELLPPPQKPAPVESVRSMPASRQTMSPMGLPVLEPDVPLPSNTPSTSTPLVNEKPDPVVEEAPAMSLSENTKASETGAGRYRGQAETRHSWEKTAETSKPQGDQIPLGNAVVTIPKAGQEMEVETITTGGGEMPKKTWKKVDAKERKEFVAALGEMSTNPEAVDFVLKNWGKTATPAIGFDVPDQKDQPIRMYAKGPDGKRVAFIPPSTEKDDDGKPIGTPDVVSRDFYEGYKKMVSLKDNIPGLSIQIPKEKAATKSPPPRPDLQQVVEEANRLLAEGKVDRAESRRMITEASRKGDEKNLADTKFKIESEEEEERKAKQSQNKGAVEKIKAEIKSIEKKLSEGKESFTPFSFGSSGGAASVTTDLSVKKRNQLVILRSNLLKKLAELQ